MSKRSAVKARGGLHTLAAVNFWQLANFAFAFMNAVVLARELDLQGRGEVAVMNLGTSVGAIIGAFGFPEVALISGAPTAEIPVRWKLGFGLLGCASVTVIAFTAAGISDPVVLALLVLVAGGSIQNMYALVALQLHGGWVASIRLSAMYSGIVCLLSTFLFTARSDSRNAHLIIVFSGWLLAEMALGCAVARIRGQKPVATARPPHRSPATAARGGRHALAQLGTLFTDRGAITLAAVGGNVSAAGILAVAQSATAPASLPVQAATNAILGNPERGPFGRKKVVLYTLATCTLVSVGLGVSLPYIAGPIFGARYAFIGSHSWVVALTAVLGSAWRVGNLTLRSRGLPLWATGVDLLALSAGGIFIATGLLTTDVSTLVYLLVYAAAGSCGVVGLLAGSRPTRLT